jgi:hypothetical protein
VRERRVEEKGEERRHFFHSKVQHDHISSVAAASWPVFVSTSTHTRTWAYLSLPAFPLKCQTSSSSASPVLAARPMRSSFVRYAETSHLSVSECIQSSFVRYQPRNSFFSDAGPRTMHKHHPPGETNSIAVRSMQACPKEGVKKVSSADCRYCKETTDTAKTSGDNVVLDSYHIHRMTILRPPSRM